MDFWKYASGAVTKAVDHMVELNRRTAMINRLKIVIRNEKDNKDHAFIQLGKYYYNNLRDPQNGDTETYCAAIDKASTRLKRACAKLDELAAPTETCCGGTVCGPCGAEPDEDDEFFPEDAPEETAPKASAEEPEEKEPGDKAEEAETTSAAAPTEPIPTPADPAKEEAADDSEEFLNPSGSDEPKVS